MFNIFELRSKVDNNDIDDKKEVSRQTHFLLCQSCFWCASYLSSKSVSIAKCPNCYNNRIQWMPISKVNFYKLGYNPKKGDHLCTIQHSPLGDRK
jgi:hypothetical protein